MSSFAALCSEHTHVCHAEVMHDEIGMRGLQTTGPVPAGWPVLGPFSLLGKHHTEMSEHDVHIVNKILLEYVGNVSSIKAENIEKITNMFTDSFFSYGINKFLDLHLPRAKTKTYQYIFSYKEHSRASHSSELPLLWGVFKGSRQITSSGEIRMSKLLTTKK